MALGDHLTYRHDIAFTESMMPALRTIMDAREGELVDGPSDWTRTSLSQSAMPAAYAMVGRPFLSISTAVPASDLWVS